jgi:hypothetical protein
MHLHVVPKGLFIVLTLLFASPFAVSAQSPVACAVEWREAQPDPGALCAAIGRSLSRAVQRVDDARKVKRGDSVQVLDGEVSWITVWLRDGKVRAFTRVSKTAAQGKELAALARAVLEISCQTHKDDGCVRVELTADPSRRSTDVVYPWAELGRCREAKPEVPDPWTT